MDGQALLKAVVCFLVRYPRIYENYFCPQVFYSVLGVCG